MEHRWLILTAVAPRSPALLDDEPAADCEPRQTVSGESPMTPPASPSCAAAAWSSHSHEPKKQHVRRQLPSRLWMLSFKGRLIRHSNIYLLTYYTEGSISVPTLLLTKKIQDFPGPHEKFSSTSSEPTNV